MTAIAARSIADLLASDEIQGEVTITGRVTDVDRRTSGAGLPWAVVTLTDDGLNVIPVHLFPKTYAGLAIEPRVGDIVAATGRLCLSSEDQQLTIYGQQLDHIELWATPQTAAGMPTPTAPRPPQAEQGAPT